MIDAYIDRYGIANEFMIARTVQYTAQDSQIKEGVAIMSNGSGIVTGFFISIIVSTVMGYNFAENHNINGNHNTQELVRIQAPN